MLLAHCRTLGPGFHVVLLLQRKGHCPLPFSQTSHSEVQPHCCPSLAACSPRLGAALFPLPPVPQDRVDTALKALSLGSSPHPWPPPSLQCQLLGHAPTVALPSCFPCSIMQAWLSPPCDFATLPAKSTTQVLETTALCWHNQPCQTSLENTPF